MKIALLNKEKRHVIPGTGTTVQNDPSFICDTRCVPDGVQITQDEQILFIEPARAQHIKGNTDNNRRKRAPRAETYKDFSKRSQHQH